MKTAKKRLSDSEQEALEKNRLAKAISGWVGKNKKAFWKYEVSCFYRTYMIRVNNLPEPSVKDVQLAYVNRLITEKQKEELCAALTKACASAKVFRGSSIDAQIDYNNGTVVTELV